MRLRPSQEKKQPKSVLEIINKLLDINKRAGGKRTVQPSIGRELAMKVHELRQALAILPEADKQKIREHFAKTEYEDLIGDLVSEKKAVAGSFAIAGNINEKFRDMLQQVLPESCKQSEGDSDSDFDPSVLSQFSTFRVVGTQRGVLSEQALSSIQSAHLDREYLADLESCAGEITPIELLVKSLQALYAVKKSGSRLGKDGHILTHAKFMREAYEELEPEKQKEFKQNVEGHPAQGSIYKLIANENPRAQLATARDLSKMLKEDDALMEKLAALRGSQRKFSK